MNVLKFKAMISKNTNQKFLPANQPTSFEDDKDRPRFGEDKACLLKVYKKRKMKRPWMLW